MKEQTYKLLPWISFNEKLKGLPSHIIYNSLQNIKQPCSLISIISIQPQLLHLVSNLQLSENTDYKTLVYLSDLIQLEGKNCRIVYIPPNKTQNESVQYLSDMMRELSDVVISDINSSGLNRIRGRENTKSKRFVVVNGRDIYRAEFGDGQIELVKKVQMPLLSTFQHKDSEFREIQLELVLGSLQKYEKTWELLLGAEKSWSQLSISALQHFRAQVWLKNSSQEIISMRRDKKMLSKKELEHIHEDMIDNEKPENSLQSVLIEQSALQIMSEIESENQKFLMNFLKQMQINCAQFISISDMQQKKQNIAQTLALYGVSPDFVQFVSYEKQKLFILGQKDALNSHILQLNAKIKSLEDKISQKSTQIQEFKHELEEYSSKFVHLIEVERKFQEIVKKQEEFRYKNDRLTSELEAHIIIQKKYFTANEELQQKVKLRDKENRGMLECLRELTQESLGLHTKIQKQDLEIHELKQQIKKNTQIQVVALRSIENQAEIKTRLQRYEHYVRDLKLSLKSFRRLQSEKFNYILSRNYKQYAKLKEESVRLSLELQQSRQLNQELSNGLQREKTRMAYFQKYLRNTYNTEPIPECSEENSADREIQTICEG